MLPSDGQRPRKLARRLVLNGLATALSRASCPHFVKNKPSITMESLLSNLGKMMTQARGVLDRRPNPGVCSIEKQTNNDQHPRASNGRYDPQRDSSILKHDIYLLLKQHEPITKPTEKTPGLGMFS
jgi:hypothetical protein